MRNKFTSIALSLMVAFGLWMYVITTVSPGYEDTFYNVNVVQEGMALLEERNLVLTYQSASRVAISASGNRTDVNKLDSGNITVKLDLSRVYEPGTMIPLQYSVTYPGDVPNGAVTTTRKNPDTIFVTVRASCPTGPTRCWTITKSPSSVPPPWRTSLKRRSSK